MTTDCNPGQLEFQGVDRRTVVAAFDGGTLTSDGGLLLLSEVERRRGILRPAFRISATPTTWSTASRS
jgi:hypothetical protein